MQLAKVYDHTTNRERLEAMGLDEAILRQAVIDGELARASCTDNDPRVFRGQIAWARATRGLREALIPRGWKAAEKANLPVVVSPDNSTAITVSSGDDCTGLRDRSPKTRNPKGAATLAAIMRNVLQLNFGFIDDDDDEAQRLTWVLLVARTRDEVRCELSLPAAIGEGGRVTSWAERIIMEPVSLGAEEPVSPPENEAAVEIEVVRKPR